MSDHGRALRLPLAHHSTEKERTRTHQIQPSRLIMLPAPGEAPFALFPEGPRPGQSMIQTTVPAHFTLGHRRLNLTAYPDRR
jgi:hypothetical protein